MFEEAVAAIEKYKRIIIHRHSNPDGDALGSQIGLKNLIKDNYPDKEVYIVGDGAKRFAFIEGSEMDVISDELYFGALAVILDTSASALISDARYKTAGFSLRLDHHIFCEKIADTEITDSSYESCCGLIAALALESGWKISDLTAKSLFTGMVTDSGRFRYDSVSPRTFRIAAELAERNIKPNDIYSCLYEEDYDNLRLRAYFILKIKFTPNNVAYIYTTADELKELGAELFTVSRGMVNTMADLRGVNIWVNFTETDSGVLCELRSNKYNINPVAVSFGGGGHKKASGATVKDRAAAMEMLDTLDKLAKEGTENEL